MHRRPRFGGAVLGLMVIKPHLAVMVPVALVIWRRWETLGWAGGVALCLVVLSGAVLAWELWPAFLLHGHEVRETIGGGLGVGFTKIQSMFAVSRALGSPLTVAYALHFGIFAIAVAGLGWSRRRGVPPAMESSLIVVAGLLTTPYLLHYDTVITTLPLAWMLRHWIDTSFPPWSKLVLVLVLLAPALFIVKGPVFFGPAALLLLAAYLAWCVGAACRTVPKDLADAPA